MAYAALAELKGVAASVPNQGILINSLGLQEAKDSSAIKNIITTHGELYLSELNLEANNAGFRRLPGTALKNAITGEETYSPSQSYDEIVRLMGNLEKYINEDKLSDFDPIVKMVIIHFQFESIHPFYDGNGRTGHIINILYLISQKLQTLPLVLKNDT
jgi:Fic family protein